MTDNINHPAHYTQGFETRPIECIDITQHMGFCDGNACKYVWRAGKKGGHQQMIEDLKKAEWYLDRLIHVLHATGEEGNSAAKGAFSLIAKLDGSVTGRRWTETNRYLVLRAIVNGEYYWAMSVVSAAVKGEQERQVENKR